MRLSITLPLFCMVFLVTSCAPIKKISGYVPLENAIQKLVVGESSKGDILLSLGEPLVSDEGPPFSLMYIQQEYETKAFFKPKVKNRVIVQLIFDNRSVLSKVNYLDDKSANSVRIEKEIVKSEGRQLTFWQQMFGNVGNFSSAQFIK